MSFPVKFPDLNFWISKGIVFLDILLLSNQK